jgi:hypothetical protein
MLDELDHLRRDVALQTLLHHYAALGREDRQRWQDRVQELAGVEERRLVRLHGELLAFGWVEQNTGNTPTLRVGAALECYRITPAGLWAVKDLLEGEREAA